MWLTLPARQPFSFAAVVKSHGWIQLAPFQADEQGGFSYVMQLATGRVLELTVEAAAGGAAVAVADGLAAAECAEVERSATWMLGLDQDFSVFYALTAAEPKLAQAQQRTQGRVLRSATLFEDAVKTILTTNTTWGGTIRMVQTLVTRYGAPLPADPARHAFPSAGQLASLDEATLRSEGKLGFRAPSVLALARSVANANLDLEDLKASGLPTLELRKRLLAIRGIGPYAAANMLMLLGHYDYLPVDSWALKMVSQEWHGGQPIGPAEVEAAFAGWGQWKGLVYWFWDWSPPK